MNVPLDLANKLTDMNLQLDAIKEQMEAQGLPPALILFHDTLVRNAYTALITCQHERAPIEDIDEAIVASFASILFDYMQRVHPVDDKKNVIGHLGLIFDDIKERLAPNVAEKFTVKEKVPKIKLVKH